MNSQANLFHTPEFQHNDLMSLHSTEGHWTNKYGAYQLTLGYFFGNMKFLYFDSFESGFAWYLCSINFLWQADE